jgi:hypothetical protein
VYDALGPHVPLEHLDIRGLKVTEPRQMYEVLIRRFLAREVDMDDFSLQFMTLFKNHGIRPEGEFAVLDTLFGDVDSFTRDVAVLEAEPDFYLTEAQLRDRAAFALQALEDLAPE